MNNEIEKYNALQSEEDKNICNRLMDEINRSLTIVEGKIWHGNPVWFIDGNPIVGYSKLKTCIQLLFWSGASFEEGLKSVGKHKAAEARYTDGEQINIDDLTRWLNKSKEIQWDYKNIVKRNGILERLK
ncbi:MAG: DUF1801 domain-containing protein [Clostridiaceae bacterium]|nr:DUF1801 domain-containing protein [Clostridiaceae bacterium]